MKERKIMRIHPDKTLALIIDYQERLMPAIKDNDTLAHNTGILLSGLDLLEIPMLVSRQYPKGLGDTIAEVREKTRKAKIFDKTTFSCWGEGAIREEITNSGRKNIILCGIETHICCLQTAVDLLEAEYSVLMVADCLGSRKSNDKKMGLRRAAQEGAILTTYESILFELTVGKESPAFKGISQLVK